ncbi:hypothetical protein GCM10029976_037180 [Kribbella albertanoniae]|uniref:Uncharacterized protein n=1 Tax=Kribbella albertanoniae TaxID=1266829 RepID=A0A4R4PTX8_9ACTN|nr:hypothetical protein [Kribbella albertanoniae]TDC25850.1 hypothetical protein E1261_23450 [Kribbella albertanoniae]
MRNYWALLPAIAVIVGLILLYAIPTLINPQWTKTVLNLFRQYPEDDQAEAGQPAGTLGPQQIRSRRMLAGLLVAGALALVGFNVSLNRESNGCYTAAKAFGAIDSKSSEDPCISMIFGTFIGDGTGPTFEEKPQPVTVYQVIEKKKPSYLRWIQNPPKYENDTLLLGTSIECAMDLRVEEADDKITVFVDTDAPCPGDTGVSLTSFKLKQPLADRKLVTVGGKEMQRIDADALSWPKVLGKLVTGG